MKDKRRLIAIIALVVVAAGITAYFLLRRPDLSGRIVLPYIAHQKPAVDPHLPASTPLSDKLDEVQFDGLFNLSANPSGVVYVDGLGELVGIDPDNVVTVRLKANKRWSDSYRITQKDDEITINRAPDHYFTGADLQFTITRIMTLGSLSPDYILLTQAMENPGFEGPNERGEVKFHFRQTRIWTEADIKETFTFKILPANSPMNAASYSVGTAAYMALPPKEGVSDYIATPDGGANIGKVLLSPFIDNSTFTTELRNHKINMLLETPFGALSPTLAEKESFFIKSNVSTTFFALLFNTARLDSARRVAVRRMLTNSAIEDRFFKLGSPQQRHLRDYKGNKDNYADYLNSSVFPSSSYYVEEKVVEPARDMAPPDLSVLPDTVRIKACTNFGMREEYSDLIAILNDPTVSRGKIKATAASNEEIIRGDYDAVLVGFTGYRSNFLFDLYDVFMRRPDLATHTVTLETAPDEKGMPAVLPASLRAENNFCRLDATVDGPSKADIKLFLQYLHGFMSTRQIGDKQEYARRIDQLEHQLCLGAWLFSLPSTAYFSNQYDSTSIDLYGVASQLSTIKKWKENPDY
jgi:hypothetical protein